MTEIKLIAALVVLLALGVGTIAILEHEREVGETTIKNADKEADARVAAAVEKANAEWQARVNLAEKGATDAEQKLEAYIASVPDAGVVCHANSGGSGVPKDPAPTGAPPGANPGPRTGSDVLQGSNQPSPDISAELDTILRSFGELAISNRELQAIE